MTSILMLKRHIRAAVVLALVPLQAGRWDARSYVPPGEPGYIYTVIHPVRPGGISAARPVSVQVSWGAWRQTGRVAPGSGAPAARGVVLRLRHSKWDRYRLTVRTTGRIVSGPVQGGPPPQWDQPGYVRVIW